MQVLLSTWETGRTGESLALKYLKDRGFEIIEKNFRTPLGEIDIIAKKKGTLHFFEVKARKGMQFGTPHEAVTNTKKRHIRRTAEWFLAKNAKLSMPCLFGVIGIDLSRTPPSIDCLLDAFE